MRFQASLKEDLTFLTSYEVVRYKTVGTVTMEWGRLSREDTELIILSREHTELIILSSEDTELMSGHACTHILKGSSYIFLHTYVYKHFSVQFMY